MPDREADLNVHRLNPGSDLNLIYVLDLNDMPDLIDTLNFEDIPTLIYVPNLIFKVICLFSHFIRRFI